MADMPQNTPEELPDERLHVLDEFLANNPSARLRSHTNGIVIERPWDDDTLALQIPWDNTALHSMLNGVILPPLFTAVYHTSTNDLEVIYTALAIEPDLQVRSFEFHSGAETCTCEFAPCSETLLAIAATAQFIKAPSTTAHRNLPGFYLHQHYKDEHPDDESAGHPYSFWIRSVPWHQESLSELVRHLNFFMVHFDRQSPRILLHEEIGSHDIQDIPVRYPMHAFP